jgi:hypothetical protein
VTPIFTRSFESFVICTAWTVDTIPAGSPPMPASRQLVCLALDGARTPPVLAPQTSVPVAGWRCTTSQAIAIAAASSPSATNGNAS